MEVIVLGVGDLTNPFMTNTSFLLRRPCFSPILIDCGYNVFENLLRYNAEDIKDVEVFITHLHSDHVGSLGNLIYYKYFKYGVPTYIYTSPDQMEKLKTLLNLMVSDVYDHHNSTAYRIFDKRCYRILETRERVFKVDHFGGEFGIYFPSERIAFTGDTDILNQDSIIFQEARAIFHDCSMVDIPKGIHASINDIQRCYSDKTKEKLILVHHGLKQLPPEHKNLKFATEGETFKF